jgi:hypothetical protein
MTVPGSGFWSLPPDWAKNLAFTRFFTTITVSLGLKDDEECNHTELATLPGTQPTSRSPLGRRLFLGGIICPSCGGWARAFLWIALRNRSGHLCARE